MQSLAEIMAASQQQAQQTPQLEPSSPLMGQSVEASTNFDRLPFAAAGPPLLPHVTPPEPPSRSRELSSPKQHRADAAVHTSADAMNALATAKSARNIGDKSFILQQQREQQQQHEHEQMQLQQRLQQQQQHYEHQLRQLQQQLQQQQERARVALSEAHAAGMVKGRAAGRAEGQSAAEKSLYEMQSQAAEALQRAEIEAREAGRLEAMQDADASAASKAAAAEARWRADLQALSARHAESVRQLEAAASRAEHERESAHAAAGAMQARAEALEDERQQLMNRLAAAERHAAGLSADMAALDLKRQRAEAAARQADERLHLWTAAQQNSIGHQTRQQPQQQAQQQEQQQMQMQVQMQQRREQQQQQMQTEQHHQQPSNQRPPPQVAGQYRPPTQGDHARGSAVSVLVPTVRVPLGASSSVDPSSQAPPPHNRGSSEFPTWGPSSSSWSHAAGQSASPLAASDFAARVPKQMPPQAQMPRARSLREVVGADEARATPLYMSPSNLPHHERGALPHSRGGDENAGIMAGARSSFSDSKDSSGSARGSWASPFATEGTAAVMNEAVQPLERALLKLNVEKSNLGGERDRLTSRSSTNVASKSSKERQRLRDVEQRLSDIDRESQQLRNRIRTANPLEYAR